MKCKGMVFGIVVSVFASLSVATAQEEVFQRGVELGIGARALGMGGAYIAIADDYSAAFWNPAGLTQIRRLEGFGTLTYAQRKNNASFGSESNLDELTKTRFNSLGLAYPVPTYQGSLVFSLGYHSVKPFDSSVDFKFLNTTPDDSVTQSVDELEEGSLNNWVFAGAVEVAPNFSFGAAFNVWSGENIYQLTFDEYDLPYDLYITHYFHEASEVTSRFSGYNLKLGGLYRPIPNLRLGFTIATPVTYTIKEEFRWNEEWIFDARPDSTPSGEGTDEYKLRSPFTFGLGASLNVANLLLAGSVEHSDWSQVRYVSDPPFADMTKAEANKDLQSHYRSTLRYRLGAEMTLPIIDLQVRAGYFYDPTPLGPDYFAGGSVPKDANREFFTAGAGVFLDKQVRLDLGVITGQWLDYKDPDFSEKITFNQAFAALAVRF
jgi:long-subunit fatty acid transport protein